MSSRAPSRRPPRPTGTSRRGCRRAGAGTDSFPGEGGSRSYFARARRSSRRNRVRSRSHRSAGGRADGKATSVPYLNCVLVGEQRNCVFRGARYRQGGNWLLRPTAGERGVCASEAPSGRSRQFGAHRRPGRRLIQSGASIVRWICCEALTAGGRGTGQPGAYRLRRSGHPWWAMRSDAAKPMAVRC